jgi:hypothetical protein
MSSPVMEQERTHSDAEVAAFLNALTELSRQHKIGITGDPVLFSLEDEDMNREYASDAESNLLY